MPKAPFLRARNFAQAGLAERAFVFAMGGLWLLYVAVLVAWAFGLVDCPLVRNWWLFCGS